MAAVDVHTIRTLRKVILIGHKIKLSASSLICYGLEAEHGHKFTGVLVLPLIHYIKLLAERHVHKSIAIEVIFRQYPAAMCEQNRAPLFIEPVPQVHISFIAPRITS